MGAELAHDGEGRWRLSGELDFASVPVVWSALAPQLDGSDWVLDLSAVARSNSAALALLLEARSATLAKGGVMRVTGLPEGLLQLGQMSGLDVLLAEMSA